MSQANQSSYTDMLKQQGAVAGEGLNGLAKMTSSALALGQGHAELPPSRRKPLTPGHSAQREDIPKANYEGREYASNR